MTRFSYRLFRLVFALHHHLPRRLTKAGLLALGGMIMAGAVGSDIDQSVAFQAFALVFCLLAVALLWIPSFRGEFVAHRHLPRLASVGQAFRYRVEVGNSSSRAYRRLEVLDNLADPYPSFADFSEAMRPAQTMKTFRLSPRPGPGMDLRRALIKPATLDYLGAGNSADGEIEVMPLRRGPLRFSGLTVARQDPLGLARAFVRVTRPETVLVLPRRYQVPNANFPGTRHYQPGGVALASSIGESEEFVSLREYRSGDPFRRIHWRSWARIGRPIVKEYQDEFFVRHGLILDTLASKARGDTFEEAVSVAASFACALDTQESLLDLLFAGAQAFCFTSGRGLGHSEQILEILASVKPTRGTPFERLRELVLRHAPLLSGCVCVLLDWDPERADLVRRIEGLGLPVRTLVIGDKSVEKALDQDLDKPAAVHFLQPGQIAEGLQRLDETKV
jgi:uncharacterized protein (DUF58 family)